MAQPRDYQDQAKLSPWARMAVVGEVPKSPAKTLKALQSSLAEIKECVQKDYKI